MYAPGNVVCTQQVAALFCMKLHNDHHLKSVMSYHKSYSVNQCIFTWKTFLPNFILIYFKQQNLRLFFVDGCPNNKNKMSSNMGSVQIWFDLISSWSKKPTDLKESKVLVKVDLTGDNGIALSCRHAGHVYLVVEEVHHSILYMPVTTRSQHSRLQPPIN